MRVLDLDMDYFMKSVATFINESEPERLPEEDYGDSVWSEREVRNFLEGNLGLSKQNRIRGRVVAGHNESLFFWRELIEKGDLSTPFDVIHVDSHADLGLGYSSWTHILDYLLYYPVEERCSIRDTLTHQGICEAKVSETTCFLQLLTGGYPVLFTVEILMANVMTICWTL